MLTPRVGFHCLYKHQSEENHVKIMKTFKTWKNILKNKIQQNLTIPVQFIIIIMMIDYYIDD